ncbi:NFAT protein [Aphelenchoides avenae]|nr:NFAT protein [Aphelenchus avenae]
MSIEADYDDWIPPSWPAAPPQIPGAIHVSPTDHYVSSSHQLGSHPSDDVCGALQQQKSPSAPSLVIVRQPEEQHRARYLSEGSRGAIKDRSGSSHCTIQVCGYHRPTRVEMFAATGNGHVEPHPLYRLIPVTGKSANTTPTRKVVAEDGVECLEVVLRPELSMTAVLDCVGLLKICSYDAKQRRQSRGCQHNCVRIAFRAYIPSEVAKGRNTVVHAQSEQIRCVQQLGVPEVLKMSLGTAPAAGGQDLFIIGRNFDRNAAVVFREYKDDGSLAWSAEATLEKGLLHQCHIVCKVPQYYNTYRGGQVSVTVRCGNKHSHPSNFVYTPCEPEDDWRPPHSPDVSTVGGRFDFAECETQRFSEPSDKHYGQSMSYVPYGLNSRSDSFSSVPSSSVSDFLPENKRLRTMSDYDP